MRMTEIRSVYEMKVTRKSVEMLPGTERERESVCERESEKKRE